MNHPPSPNPLLQRLRAVRAEGRAALCGYFLAGYPDPDAFFRGVRAADALDIIEYGIPADDPAMDGPTIAEAHRVVTRQRGIHAEPALALIRGVRAPQPAFVMTYTTVGRTLEGFLGLCVEAGVHGVLVPDIDPLEGAFVAERSRALGLAVASLLDVDADDDAVGEVARRSDLVYLKAAPGATGGRLDVPARRGAIERARARLRAERDDLLVAVGIGVQEPGQVADLARMGIDMVVVGTKVVEEVTRGPERLGTYLRELRAATRLAPAGARRPAGARAAPARPLAELPTLALDVGTTATKAAVLAPDGTVLTRAEAPLETYRGASGEVEQDAIAWWSSVRAAVAEARRDEDLGAIVLTGQMQDLTLTEASGAPLRPTLLYADTRAREEAGEVVARLGAQALRGWTGNDQDAAGLLAKLRWLRRHEPHTVSRAELLFLGAADLIAHRLTGAHACDTTTASTTGLLLLDSRGPLPDAVLDALELADLARLLPRFVRGGACVGALRADAARALGLPAGLPVHLGPGDAGATTIGAGSGEPGPVYGYLGTSGWVAFTADGRGDPDAGVFTLAHPADDRFVQVAPLLTAGGNLAWIRDLLSGAARADAGARGSTDLTADQRVPYGRLIDAALARPPTRLLYLPYLAGERAPLRDPLARAAFVGLDATTTAEDLVRAALEGVACAYRHALEALVPHRVERLRLTGGGTRSEGWSRLIASVVGVPVEVHQDASDAGLVGALRSAQVAAGAAADYGVVPRVHALQPDPALRRHYDHLYAGYRGLYPALRATFAHLADAGRPVLPSE